MKNYVKYHIYQKRFIHPTLFPLCCLICFFLIFTSPPAGLADIQFKEATKDAGIHHAGTTYGASWGDFNADGWPDLWVGNHNTKPTLYLNKQDGTFENIIDQVWSGDSKADTHGVAWADFDNDGDQDFVEVVDVKENEDGTFCMGCGKNHLYINENGKLRERAADFGLDHTGHGRSALWCDFNQDGLLDLLVVNMYRHDQPDSRVYLQKNSRFVIANETLRFKDGQLDWYEKIRGRISKLLNFQRPSLAGFNTQRFLEFAQLADLSSSGYPNLILYSKPSRVFAIDSTPFKNITHNVGLPKTHQISDVAIADFNGDQRMDMYVAKGLYMPSDVIRTSPFEIRGRINNPGGGSAKAVHFQAEGNIHFQLYPTWVHLSEFYIGSIGHHPTNRSFTLSPQDSNVYGPTASAAAESNGISITYDPDSRTWKIHNFNKNSHVDFIAKATDTISEYKAINFNPFEPKGIDSLLLKRNDEFVKKTLVGEAGAHTSCYFVAAGDFDNDMDMDLYLTCTGPVANLPNRLLENDGKGNFTLVSDAGGATGSQLGRGDVVACADYDSDGFLDLFITNGHDPTSPFVADGPHQLFRNQGNNNNWLELDLEGVVSNRDGIGSRVEVAVGSIVQIREQTGGMHRITQNYQRLHFGLGKHVLVDRITVNWPSGVVQHLNNIKANQILHITEPS